MKKPLEALRDKTTTTVEFRNAAHAICGSLLEKTKMRMRRQRVDSKHIVAVVIFRSAVAFLDAALQAFPDASVGVLGFKRDDLTFKPRFYYENLPPLSKKHTVILFDPMLATGGSAQAALKRLKKRGANVRKIYFVGIVAAPEGLVRIMRLIRKENIVLAAVDKGLDKDKMIVPGVGDFGDRYFGYAGRAVING